jgi:hypothetical protein
VRQYFGQKKSASAALSDELVLRRARQAWLQHLHEKENM